ncbi:crossover junction endodeoxyribonuclease RuvC, partial [Plantactinospora sp. S1510]
AGLPVQTYTPSEVKAAVTGSGQADKAQMMAMVTRLLRLDAPPRPADAADALALAICHIWRGGTRARLAAAASAVRQRVAAQRSTAKRQGGTG